MQTADEDGQFTMVFSGFDPLEAGMLARLIEAEGITCRHLGSQHPAAFGVGEYACEQRLEVPDADAAQARELIAAAREAPAEPDETSDD
jgi:hypothetical protein